MIKDYRELRNRLAREAEDEYREFIMRGIPSERPFIGVRVPKIRELVAEIPREKYTNFLTVEPVAFEEVLARGFIIAKLPYEEMLKYFDSQIGYIDDWCACDTFAAALRPVVKKSKSEFMETKVERLLDSEREFAVRVGLAVLLDFYVEFDYLWVIFDRVEELAMREEYYIRMAVAWLVAECFIKFPDETLGFLKTTQLPKWTYNKAIAKICDSRRVEPEAKEYLKTLRKK